MAEEKHLLVTVGTTQFNDLIEYIDKNASSFLKIIQSHNINSITIQKGNGIYFPHHFIKESKSMNIKTTVIDYTKTSIEFKGLLSKSYLIISHAGAGSILESLSLHKKLFVVINDTLMNNHQIEICRPLYNLKYLYYSNVKNLNNTLKQCDFSHLKPYPKPDYNAFPNIINLEMGI